MSSLTADISDTNFLLDDVLHQLSLHADYSLLKSIKHQYTDIHNTRLSQQAAIKTSISQLSRGINELEDGIRGVGIAEVKAWKEGVKGSVQEKEEEVAELKTEEGRLSAEVKAKEEEGQRLEQKRKDRVKRHGERMHSHKSATASSHPRTGSGCMSPNACLILQRLCARSLCLGSVSVSTPSSPLSASTSWMPRRYEEVRAAHTTAASRTAPIFPSHFTSHPSLSSLSLPRAGQRPALLRLFHR